MLELKLEENDDNKHTVMVDEANFGYTSGYPVSIGVVSD